MAYHPDENENPVARRLDLDKEIGEAMLGRERERDAIRRGLYADERRRHAEAVEPRPRGAPAAMPDASPRSSAISASADPALEHESSDRGKARQSAAIREHQQHAGASAHSVPVESRYNDTDARRPASAPDGRFLEKYARTFAIARPVSVSVSVSSPADPRLGVEKRNDWISQAPMTGATRPGEGRGGDDGNINGNIVSPVASEPIGGDRIPAARMVRHDSATRETISRALTLDRALGDRALESSSIGLARSSVRDDGRSPESYSSSYPRTMFEPTRGPRPHVGAMDTTRDGNTAKDSKSIGAAAEELERLRSAARRAAAELGKVRGPVPPALPSRPPAFRDRS